MSWVRKRGFRVQGSGFSEGMHCKAGYAELTKAHKNAEL